MDEDESIATWSALPDEMVGRIVSLVDTKMLQHLVVLEKRTRPLFEARLRLLAAPRLHELARRGDADAISHHFHKCNGSVLLLLNGEHTILHTAIEARQLDLVQWLVQPLSVHNKYTPLSSSVVSYRGNSNSATITPLPLFEEQCQGLFNVDGPKALRAAASRGDLELIDRLLPCCTYYPSIGEQRIDRPFFGRATRELLIELRNALLAPAATSNRLLQMAAANEDHLAALQGAADMNALLTVIQELGLESHVRDVQQRAHILDRRLRNSDIEWHFWMRLSDPEKLQSLKAKEEAVLAEGRRLFDWRWPDDPYTQHEMENLSRALKCAVVNDRIDLCRWLIDSWSAEFVSRQGHRLSELTIVGHSHDIDKLLRPPRANHKITLDPYESLGGNYARDSWVVMAVDEWRRTITYVCDASGARITGVRYRRLPCNDEEAIDYDLCEVEYQKLHVDEQARYDCYPPEPPKNCATLAKHICEVHARLQDMAAMEESGRRSSVDTDDRALKGFLEKIAPTAPGCGGMLAFLDGRGYVPPRLSVVACAGAIWALEWLLARGATSLDDPVYPRKGFGSIRRDSMERTLSRDLRSAAPWLASAVAQHAREGRHLTLGIVLAALAISRGSLALVEWLVARGADVQTLRFAGDRSLLHVIARDAPVHAVVWLVENGPAGALVHRSANGTSPLHEAILAGHAPVMCHLIECGGAAGDDPNDPKCIPWDELAVRSEHEDIRKMAEDHRAKIACSVLLPNILRSHEGSAADMEASLDALLAQHATSMHDRLGFHGTQAIFRRLIRAALDGGRAPIFLRWFYAKSGLTRGSGGILGRIHDYSKYSDRSCDTHIKLWRVLASEHGGTEGAAPEVTAALDALVASEEHSRAVKDQLRSLDKRLVRLWERGSSLAEIETVQDELRLLLDTAPSSSYTKERAIVYGMSMSTLVRWDAPGVTFTVKQAACDDAGAATTGNCSAEGDDDSVNTTRRDDGGILGSFDLLTACALNGHLHLVKHLLAMEAKAQEADGGNGDEGANARVGSSLATTLEWNGPLSSVRLLCAYLETRDVDLNTIQRQRDAAATKGYSIDSDVGVIDNALKGILQEWIFLTDQSRRRASVAARRPTASVRMDAAFAKVSWLVANTKAKLRPGAFARLLRHYTLSGDAPTGPFRARSEDESEEARQHVVGESQALVLRLTKLCVEVLGASWSDKAVDRHGRDNNALQVLLDAGWMDAVSWLARDRGAPLQGLILENNIYYDDPAWRVEHMDALRRLQEEQVHAWARVEGAL